MRLITAFPLLVLGSFMLSTNLVAADMAVKTPSPAQAAQQKRMDQLQPSSFHQIAERRKPLYLYEHLSEG